MTTLTQEAKLCDLSADAWRAMQDEHLPGYDPYATAAKDDYFDAQAANDVINFFSGLLVFIEGDRAGEPFTLEPWQMAATGATFGWKRQNGKRRYREVFRYVPRKNGKTPWLAGEVAYVMFCDREPGAQIYSAAADRDQAALVYRHLEGMIAREPELSTKALTHRSYKVVEYPDYDTFYKVLSSDARTKHGFQVHMAAIDELHAHRSRELTDVLTTGTANRSQPLVIYITTADYGRESVCNEKYDYACKVRDGVISDRAFLPVIYEAQPDDDWTDRATWQKANPNLGVSVSIEYMERECQRAQDQPTYENIFKRLHLNIRTEQDVRWLPMDRWDQCDDFPDLDELVLSPCYAGLDLASRNDIAACVLFWPEFNAVLPYFWMPRAAAKARERRDRVPFVEWAREGLLALTDGEVIDFETIEADIMAIGERYNVRGIGADRWNLEYMRQKLAKAGVDIIGIGQGYASLSAPSKELEALVVARQLRHGGNKVLRWMASNVQAEIDHAGNIKPSKKKSTEKIDGIAALVMAIAMSTVSGEPVNEVSVYQTDRPDGLLSL